MNPLKDSLKVGSVDFSVDFNNMLNKLDKLKVLFDRGSMEVVMMRYISGLSKIFYQGKHDHFKTKKKLTLVQLILIKILEFNINLTKNQCTNF